MAKNYKFVICDPDLCIACNLCEKKCVKNAYTRGRLDKSRLDVLTQDGGKMPNQCRQCDDAPCANVCPTSALRLGESYVELHEEICIGCKLCTLACPYGAVHMDADVLPSVHEKPDINLEFGCVSGFKSTAIKCDLCDGSSEDPACVTCCPKGALVMVDPVDGNHIFGKKLKADMSDFLARIL